MNNKHLKFVVNFILGSQAKQIVNIRIGLKVIDEENWSDGHPRKEKIREKGEWNCKGKKQ